jgi:hypothetical protein
VIQLGLREIGELAAASGPFTAYDRFRRLADYLTRFPPFY